MRHRPMASPGVLAIAVVVASLVPVGIAGQTSPSESSPRTPWGDPDLQGAWNNATTTPLERPLDLEGQEFLTDEEVSERDARVAYERSTDRRDEDAPALGPSAPRGGRGTVADVERAYNDFWWERGSTIASNRTSIIVDPPDGRLPAMTSAGRDRLARGAAAAGARGPSDSYDDRRLGERCIIYRGVPPIPTGYNNNYLIVQNPTFVAILQEHIHDVRIIPLDGRPAVAPRVRQWLGTSRGRWEGDTLVVETTNFNDLALLRALNGPPSESLRVVERFTRTADDTVDYRFTVEDPDTWTGPWSGSIPMTKIDGALYEYACHEGNYGMTNLLAGARSEESAAPAGTDTSR